ncbi:tRNA (adenosine(37)-N6)-threonylcarbamoyltransferase complex ATPase subunit type 1 TsaE [Patescibacteria group bacterium]|nr:tRNA (adenosine(37)-N6)-threonylcarbamoyltransferase complex ATPase subunit type 1 TsaE [Patescibacteria group bacterium]
MKGGGTIETIESSEKMEQCAEEFVKTIKSGKNNAHITGLHGELGSGKTTFVKGAAKAFGIKNMVTSPTFVIEKIYKLANKDFDHLIHIDAYRLKNGAELSHLGWKEIAKDPRNIIFIEWPENITDILPKNIEQLNFTFINENTREIEYA